MDSIDAPYYHRGNKILVSICALALVTFAITRWYFGYLVSLDDRDRLPE